MRVKGWSHQVKRREYDEETVRWADAVMAAGVIVCRGKGVGITNAL